MIELRAFDYRGFRIEQSRGHGKAVKGTKRTATVQVKLVQPGAVMMLHQVSFKVDCPPCIDEAVKKAKAWVDKYAEMREEFERCRDDKEYFIEKYMKPIPAGVREQGVDMGTVLKRIYGRLPYWMKQPFGSLQEP